MRKRYVDIMTEYRQKLLRKLLDDKISHEKYERLVEKTYDWEDRNDGKGK